MKFGREIAFASPSFALSLVNSNYTFDLVEDSYKFINVHRMINNRNLHPIRISGIGLIPSTSTEKYPKILPAHQQPHTSPNSMKLKDDFQLLW